MAVFYIISKIKRRGITAIKLTIAYKYERSKCGEFMRYRPISNSREEHSKQVNTFSRDLEGETS